MRLLQTPDTASVGPTWNSACNTRRWCSRKYLLAFRGLSKSSLITRYLHSLTFCASGSFLFPLQPHASLSIDLSSSLPGHIISPRYNARTQKKAVMIHMITKMMVRALHTPFMALLFNADDAWIVARVSPALGKMKAHQFSENDISRTPERIATVVMKKNQ